jgi:hypothetical protein
MQIVIAGVKPYDGRYQLDFDDDLTTREWGWIKRLAGYMPFTLEEGGAGGDPELACIFAAIALRRAGRVEASEVPAVFDRLADAPFGSAITIEADEEKPEDDAGPPGRSSNENGASSGDASQTSSDTLVLHPNASGTHGSAASASGPTTSVT